MPAIRQLFILFLKIDPTQRQNAFENLNYISFDTWAVTENPNFQFFVITSACKKIEQLNFCCSRLFSNGTENLEIFLNQR